MTLWRMEGTCQYPSGITGLLAQTWMTTWVLTNDGIIRDHEENGMDLTSINHPEGCTSQFHFVYHLDCDGETQGNAQNQCDGALVQGTSAPFLTAECDSGIGTGWEGD